MFRSFRIGSLLGIPIKLDVTFLLILPVFAWLIAIQVGDLVPVQGLDQVVAPGVRVVHDHHATQPGRRSTAVRSGRDRQDAPVSSATSITRLTG